MKLFRANPLALKQCRPFTGAWIETSKLVLTSSCVKRRPFTGAWIETRLLP